jgi:hypothetical protein
MTTTPWSPNPLTGTSLVNSILQLTLAVERCTDLDGLLPDGEEEVRSEARRHVSRALAELLVFSKGTEEPQALEAAATLRKHAAALAELVNAREALAEVWSHRNQVRALHQQLQEGADTGLISAIKRVSPTPSSPEICLIRQTGAHHWVGLLGTILGSDAEAAMVTGVLGGALCVAGKGMGKALDAARLLTVTHSALQEFYNQVVPVSAIAWQLDTQAGLLRMASAAHRPLWRIRPGGPGGRSEFLEARVRPAPPLGSAEFRPASQVECEVAPGDVLVGFTQGVFEVDSPTGQAIKGGTLRFALLQSLQLTPSGAVEAIAAALDRHAGPTSGNARYTALALGV